MHEWALVPILPLHLQEPGWVFLNDRAVWVANGDLKFRDLLFAAVEWNSNPGMAQIAHFAFKSQTKTNKQL